MDRKLKNKLKRSRLTTLGFTLIELIAVVVILGIILVIAVPIITNLIKGVEDSTFIVNEKMMVKAAKLYVLANQDKLPKDIGDISIIGLHELQTNQLIDSIITKTDNYVCTGEILIIRKDELIISYYPYLNCGSQYKTYSEYIMDGLIIHNDGYDPPIYENGGWYWKNKINNTMHINLRNFDNPANSEYSGYNSLKKSYITDGINDFFEILIPSSQEVILDNGSTFSVTFKCNQVPSSNYTYFPFGQHTDGYIHMGWGGNNNYFIFYGGGYNHVLNQNVKMTKFEGYNVVFVQKEDYSKQIYINGNMVADVPVSQYTPSWLKFYRLQYNIQVPLNANNYNIKVYNRPLSSSEIKTNYLIDKGRFGI